MAAKKRTSQVEADIKNQLRYLCELECEDDHYWSNLIQLSDEYGTSHVSLGKRYDSGAYGKRETVFLFGVSWQK